MAAASPGRAGQGDRVPLIAVTMSGLPSLPAAPGPHHHASNFPFFTAISLFSCCYLFPPAAWPAAQEAPDALIRRVSQEVMDIARNDPAIQAGDRRRIHAVVEAKILPHLDFQRGTALTMGRNWREATPEQRERLSAEFRNLLLYTYAGAMSQIKDQTMTLPPVAHGSVRYQCRGALGSAPAAPSGAGRSELPAAQDRRAAGRSTTST